jgi:hypothetical protein
VSKVKKRAEMGVRGGRVAAPPAETPRDRGAAPERPRKGAAVKAAIADTNGRVAAPRKGRKVSVAKRPRRAVPPAAKPLRAKGTGTGPARKPAARGARKGAGRRPAGRSGVGKTTALAKGLRQPVEPVRVVKVKELDPFAICGPRTSVVHLFRVDERVDGTNATHLVFFDRHGWYCEHGRNCRAVEDVRKLGKSLRTIQVG